MDANESTSRKGFAAAGQGFVELVAGILVEGWHRPALGTWSVRALVGHTSRALSTIETYLGQQGTGSRIADPVEYFLAATGTSSDPDARRRQAAAIAERGREAGAALGNDPAATISALAGRVGQLVDRTPGDVPVATAVGTMSLADYLPTRTFELTVHSLDLARAIGAPVPAAAGCNRAGYQRGVRVGEPTCRLPSAGGGATFDADGKDPTAHRPQRRLSPPLLPAFPPAFP